MGCPRSMLAAWWPMKTDAGRRVAVLLAVGAAALGASCNAAIGGGVVAALGGAGFLAGQCYDRVRVKVRDPHTGLTTCNASVWVSDADGSERRLRPCYNAALTEGTWKVTARHEGYVPASTELTIPDHPDDCPNYTHTVELTLRRPGEPSMPPTVTRSATATGDASPAPAASSNPLDTPAARVVPPPIPGVAPAPGVPTRSFEPLPAPPAAPAPPAPATPAPAAPVAPAAPATPAAPASPPSNPAPPPPS
jgi:hypothetical protein